MLPAIWRNRGSLFRPTSDDFVEKFFFGWPSFDKESDISWSPRVDIHETNDDILIDVELPGIDKKDINVEVKDNMLTITGERKQERKVEGTECCRSERHYGKFERTFSLTDTADADKINAAFKDGILTLTLPKIEKVKPKEVSIEVK
jgi:HSP20 family protein